MIDQKRACKPLHNIMWGRADPLFNPPEFTGEQLMSKLLANACMSWLSRQIQALKEENEFFDDDDENRWDLFGLLNKRYSELIEEVPDN